MDILYTFAYYMHFVQYYNFKFAINAKNPQPTYKKSYIISK